MRRSARTCSRRTGLGCDKFAFVTQEFRVAVKTLLNIIFCGGSKFSRCGARSLGGSDDALCRHSLPPRSPSPTIFITAARFLVNLQRRHQGTTLQHTNELLRYPRPRLLRRGGAQRRRGPFINAPQAPKFCRKANHHCPKDSIILRSITSFAAGNLHLFAPQAPKFCRRANHHCPKDGIILRSITSFAEGNLHLIPPQAPFFLFIIYSFFFIL